MDEFILTAIHMDDKIILDKFYKKFSKVSTQVKHNTLLNTWKEFHTLRSTRPIFFINQQHHPRW